eukprot:TRINITY_DN1045_c0_g1_i1.p1 TRINITY_DN1045_c0_g1~~TRINITY_DN1045_c0_g1_i1.p1  ORF type:complete len:217 (+),score=55.62 TRINITY_DN1045_c0_g1_i1:32-682(+)
MVEIKNINFSSSLDSFVRYPIKNRWIFSGILVLFFWLRILLIKGFYVVAYAYALFLLTCLIAFITPARKDLLNQTEDGEYRPFPRVSSEFNTWVKISISTIIAIFCSFITFLDFEVVPAVLIMYFVIIFIVTMRESIQDMLKYRYVPLSKSKKKYERKQIDVDDDIGANDLSVYLQNNVAIDVDITRKSSPPPIALNDTTLNASDSNVDVTRAKKG